MNKNKFLCAICKKRRYCQRHCYIFGFVKLVCDFINVNPENALSKTNKKFIDRFQLMEALMKEVNVPIEDSSLETMDIYWEKAKIQLRNK